MMCSRFLCGENWNMLITCYLLKPQGQNRNIYLVIIEMLIRKDY